MSNRPTEGIPDPLHWTEVWMPLIAPAMAIMGALIMGAAIEFMLPKPKHLYNRSTRIRKRLALYLILAIFNLSIAAVWLWDRYF